MEQFSKIKDEVQDGCQNLCSPAVIRTLMEGAGIRFRRDFGQNFLIVPEVPARIAESCADDADTVVLEIGPGIGCLTRELAARYRRVVAVEIDRGLIPVLSKTLADCPNTEVICGDILKTDLRALAARVAPTGNLAVCANLPYYITTPILMYLLESGVSFRSVTVMVQAEVAARLTAAPGTSEYGAITAVLGYYGTVRRLFTVQPGCFMPAPGVVSAVVQLVPDNPPRLNPRNPKLFFALIRAAFGQRRKTLVNALSAGLSQYDKATLTAAIVAAGHTAAIRGECLSTADFCRLADLLTETGEKPEAGKCDC